MSACTSESAKSDSEVSAAAEALAQDLPASPSRLATAEDRPPEDVGKEEIDYLYLDRVAECMIADGFEFRAPEVSGPPPEVAEWIEGSQYGIVASVLASEPDPNEEALAGLERLEQEAYLVALWGRPDDPALPGCATQALEQLSDELPEPRDEQEQELTFDRRIPELRSRIEEFTRARPEVVEAINAAIACANEKLGEGVIDDAFDFVTVAEYRVARIVDPVEADRGATLFDLVASSDEGELEIDAGIVEQMIEAETAVWDIEFACRKDLDVSVRAVFIEEAERQLATDPEMAKAIIDLYSVPGGGG